MGLRDFLLGAQQFSQGAQAFGQSSASQQLRDELPGLLQDFQSGDEQKKVNAAARAQELAQASGENNPYVNEMAKVLFAGQKPKTAGTESLSAQALMDTSGGLIDQTQAEKLSKLDRKAQEKAISVAQNKFNQQQVSSRQATSLGQQKEFKNIANYKDFNKSLQDTEVKFDDARKGLESALAQFKQNPNKSSLQQLAVSMARAGGDTGVLSNQDLAAYKLSTIAQDVQGLEAYFTDNPEQGLTPSVRDALIQMAEFGIKKSEERKVSRLKSVFENNVSVYGQNFLKDQKPDVIKNWEKRLGLNAEKTPEGIQVKKQSKEYTGEAKNMIDLANSIQDPKIKAQAAAVIQAKGGNITPDDVANFKKYLKSKGLIKE